MSLAIRPVRALKDNYVYLLRDEATGQTAAIDPSEAAPVRQALADFAWPGLSLILCTHHHWDHVGGNKELAAEFGCPVACSAYDLARVPGATIPLQDGAEISLGATRLQAIAIPGHTLGHTCYFSKADAVAFCGDTLFAFGAGRLFEGSAAQLRASLARIASLPPETRLGFGHEYAERNAAFAAALPTDSAAEPETEARWRRLRARLDSGEAATLERLDVEVATNPFYQIESAEYRARIGLEHLNALGAFTELRRRRDSW